MEKQEYKEILTRFFFRWHKERDLLVPWLNLFYQYKSFSKTFENCAQNITVCSSYQYPYSSIEIGNKLYGLPYGIATYAKGFSISQLYTGHMEEAEQYANQFKRDFICYLKEKHGCLFVF